MEVIKMAAIMKMYCIRNKEKCIFIENEYCPVAQDNACNPTIDDWINTLSTLKLPPVEEVKSCIKCKHYKDNKCQIRNVFTCSLNTCSLFKN